MTIKLRFDRHPEFPGSEVWTEDQSLAPVAGFLDSELRSVGDAREFAQRLKDVVAGKTPHFQGVGNGYFFAIFPTESEVGLDIGDDPETVSVPTAELIAAIEEWAAHLEALAKSQR